MLQPGHGGGGGKLGGEGAAGGEEGGAVVEFCHDSYRLACQGELAYSHAAAVLHTPPHTLVQEK